MIKIKFFLSIIILFFSITYSLNAQNIQIGIGGGYTKLFNNEFYTSAISEDGLGFKHGAHISFKVKLGYEALPIRTNCYVSYLPLNSEGTITLSHGDRDIGFSSNVLSYGLGIEYEISNSFLPLYISLNLKMNKFNETSLKETYPVAWAPYYLTLFRSISDETRLGIEIGFGHEFYLFTKYGIDIYIKYDILNLIGKKEFRWAVPVPQTFKEENINIFGVTASIFFNNKP